MGERARRAAGRVARMKNQANNVVDIVRDVDGGGSVSRSSEIVEEVIMVPRGRAQPPGAVPPLAMVPVCGLTWSIWNPHIFSTWKSKAWTKLFWSISVIPRNAHVNYYVPCSNLGHIWKSFAVRQAMKRMNSFSCWDAMILLLPCCVNGKIWSFLITLKIFVSRWMLRDRSSVYPKLKAKSFVSGLEPDVIFLWGNVFSHVRNFGRCYSWSQRRIIYLPRYFGNIRSN